MLSIINRIHLCEGEQDQWRWKFAADGLFRTKSAYVCLVARSPAEQGDRNDSVSFDLVWCKLAPFKASSMAWRLPTKANLLRRRVIGSAVEAKCPLCDSEIETAAHLFLGCPHTSEVWFEIYRWLSITSAMHNQVREHFLQFSGYFHWKRGESLAACTWICCVWVIWKWRNKIIFENVSWNKDRVVEEIRGRVWSWISAKEFSLCNLSYRMWMLEPRICLDC